DLSTGFTTEPLFGATLDPYALAVDPSGRIVFAEIENHCVRRMDVVSSTITTIAGQCGLSGYNQPNDDGSEATSARLTNPASIAYDSAGNLYIGEGTFLLGPQPFYPGKCRVRRVDAIDGTISTYAGNGVCGTSGDGGPAASASIGVVDHIRID